MPRSFAQFLIVWASSVVFPGLTSNSFSVRCALSPELLFFVLFAASSDADDEDDSS